MERIIVGYDDTPAAKAAMRWAVHEAKRTGDELVIVYVVSSVFEWELAAAQVNPDPIRHEFERRLRADWSADARAAGVAYQTQLKVGRPAEVLLDVARHNQAASIVVGMTGRGTLAELVHGSATHHLMHHAVRPIVSVPPDWVPPVSAVRPPQDARADVA